MANFDLIKTVTDIRSEIQASSAYSHDSITEQCGLEKEVWIKYYYGGTLEERTFEINGAVGLGGYVISVVIVFALRVSPVINARSVLGDG